MLKYLRIAVTALSLTACVLLVALWVRSYHRGDYLMVPITDTRSVGANSLHGWVKLSTYVYDEDDQWRWVREPARDAMLSYGEFFEAKQNRFGFGTHAIAGTNAVMMPHWFPSLIAAIFAASPWMLGRFSLRTLLIATTLVAVVLGVLVALS